MKCVACAEYEGVEPVRVVREDRSNYSVLISLRIECDDSEDAREARELCSRMKSNVFLTKVIVFKETEYFNNKGDSIPLTIDLCIEMMRRTSVLILGDFEIQGRNTLVAKNISLNQI